MVTEKLKPMEQGLNVFLVFDSSSGEGIETKITQEGRFSTVVMGKGLAADDFIMQEIDKIVKSGESFVQVVTADRELRRQALEVRSVVRGVVNPVVFWRRYRPRLTGLKKAETCC